MKEKLKQAWDKFLFPACTVINTVTAISALVTLFSPAATPATAVAVMFFGGIAVMGWLTMAYEYELAKIRRK